MNEQEYTVTLRGEDARLVKAQQTINRLHDECTSLELAEVGESDVRGWKDYLAELEVLLYDTRYTDAILEAIENCRKWLYQDQPGYPNTWALVNSVQQVALENPASEL